MDDPYRSPAIQPASRLDAPKIREAARRYPLVPRFWAASIDTMGACLLVLIVGSRFSEMGPESEVMAVVATYFLYFFLSESLFARTPAKWALGLKITGVDGAPCTWTQSLLRSVTRLIEVNPVLLGGLPAGLIILCSRHKQRLGDKLAGTVVVRDQRS